MAIRVVEFSSFSKLERFLQKNQYTQRKLLNFEFWINGELSKIGHHFSNKKFRKMCSRIGIPQRKKMRKIQMIFDIEN